MTTAPTTTVTLSTVQLKRSSEAGVRPASLLRGEPFFNLADGILLIGDGGPVAGLPQHYLVTASGLTTLVNAAVTSKLTQALTDTITAVLFASTGAAYDAWVSTLPQLSVGATTAPVASGQYYRNTDGTPQKAL